MQTSDVGFMKRIDLATMVLCLRQPTHSASPTLGAAITNWVDRGRFDLDEFELGMADFVIDN